MSEAATPAKKPRKKGGLLALVGVAVAALGAGGGGAWWFVGQQAHGAEKQAEVKKAPKKPLFTTLEPFTVNLQDPRGERFAQIGVTLQFEDPDFEVTLKDRLPAVRNEILLLVSSKQIDELITLEGKKQLAAQIRERTAMALGIDVPAPGASAPAKGPGAKAENPVRDVLFSQFIVQ